MADEDQEQGPSLELPSFGFRRRKKKDVPEAAMPEPEPMPETEPVPEPTPEREPEIVPPNEPMSEPIPPVQATQPLPPVPAQIVEPTAPAAPAEQAHQPGPVYAPLAVATGTAPETAPAEGRREVEKPKRELPRIVGLPGALVSGVTIGLLTVGLTWLALRLCTLVNGASTCGNTGILLLLAIMVAMVVAGRYLLAYCRVSDPGSTSFLGVGLMAALALLLLIGSLDQWWMVLALPVLTALTFGGAWWLTTSFVEPGERTR